MRDLNAADLGVLLSVFVVLLIFSGFDFRLPRQKDAKSSRSTKVFAVISAIGEGTAGIALILTRVSLFVPDGFRLVDTMLVFIPGSIAILCALILSLEVVTNRVISLTD